MANYILEGETFFVLDKLSSLTHGKKVEINPERTKTVSLFDTTDYYVFFDPDKETIEKVASNNFILCFLDKNLDLRLDYVKKAKQKSEFTSFEPIPTTDFAALKRVFPNLKNNSNSLPSKKGNLKYKGAKQNYEWFDLCLISDLYEFGDENIYKLVFESYFDIWKFTDFLWSGNNECIKQISYINDSNFEDYFNRIRETSKDYLDAYITNSNSFFAHKNLYPNTILTNEFRFDKVKEKLNKIQKNNVLNCISYFDDCLMNVRMGSNPKLELLKLFFKFKQHVLR